MLIKKRTGIEIPSSEITPKHHYFSRRHFMVGAAMTATAGLLAACGAPGQTAVTEEVVKNEAATVNPTASATTDELGDPLNSFEDVTSYNNYYEFNTKKDGPAKLAQNFPTSPWQVDVGGMVKNPKTYGLEDLLKFEQEERIYRLRCVEAWSMVIPWQGFPLSKILNEVEPTSEAKFVRFETIYDPDNMPGQKSPLFPWPYVEGLAVEEAMNELTLLATGLYGEELLPQNGAPVRLVAPWKYGFKSIKAIVKIELMDTMPTSLWMESGPNEYGFYANVNPNVDHPRWSQATERRIGELGRRETLMFNGYEEQVAHMYPDPNYDTNL
ncbi:MAG: protein-methionine-sulfoxide reductase catalytic subunit MsrP [Chloroflexi bacterium]|nr:protein-methionine-sulfoxide reductase catalytic subunit MsrP [Chloroflexota bacterium]